MAKGSPSPGAPQWMILYLQRPLAGTSRRWQCVALPLLAWVQFARPMFHIVAGGKGRRAELESGLMLICTEPDHSLTASHVASYWTLSLTLGGSYGDCLQFEAESN